MKSHCIAVKKTIAGKSDPLQTVINYCLIRELHHFRQKSEKCHLPMDLLCSFGLRVCVIAKFHYLSFHLLFIAYNIDQQCSECSSDSWVCLRISTVSPNYSLFSFLIFCRRQIDLKPKADGNNWGSHDNDIDISTQQRKEKNNLLELNANDFYFMFLEKVTNAEWKQHPIS